jgi:hypothetical protein
MTEADLDDAARAVAQVRSAFGRHAVVALRIGHDGHSCAVSDLRIADDGFERMAVVCAPGASPTRDGGLGQRPLEIEINRLLALRGLPTAKALALELEAIAADLAAAVAALVQESQAEEDLLCDLNALASRADEGGGPVDRRHLVLHRQPRARRDGAGQERQPAGARTGNRRRRADPCGGVGGVAWRAAHPPHARIHAAVSGAARVSGPGAPSANRCCRHSCGWPP